jgi:glycosyltransferase involved in cell wall biosynthesis
MRVSVVIPSYNHAAYIVEALESVLCTRWDELEVVVVEDGSTDDTLQRLERFRNDPRVRIFEQANAGAHAALNRGLALATGEILCILNSDDRFAPERIPRLAELLAEEPDLAMATSWIRVVDGEGSELGIKQGYHNMPPPWSPTTSGPRLADTGDPTLALLETNFVSTTSNIAFRRSLLAEAELAFANLRYTHDWDFILSACAHGRLAVVEEPLVDYRVHDANTIREGTEPERGQGAMRFEILWVIARHAESLMRARATGEHPEDDLLRRFWRSCPTFGLESLMTRLLLLRGGTEVPVPPSYDDLLREDHPFRVAAIEVLDSIPD